jgi:uncharacterized membrane protein (DUF106 family)
MDVQAFRDSRQAELSEFQKHYEFLKKEYASTLLDAINENDSQKQQELIQTILSINTSMTEELRTFLGKLNSGGKGFDPAELNTLTKELIEYQKEYAKIEESKDRSNTLKRIHQNISNKIHVQTNIFYMYMSLFVVLLVFVVMLMFRNAFTAVTSLVQQPLQSLA